MRPLNAETLGELRTAVKAGGIASGARKAAKPTAKVGRPPFVQIPLHWLPIMQRAKAFPATPLLLAIAYQMFASDKSRVPITSEIWELAGDPRDKAQRHEMIQILRRIPSVVRLEYSQRTGTKYAAVKGVWWDKAPPLAEQDDVGKGEE
jgi:hypothetical protein